MRNHMACCLGVWMAKVRMPVHERRCGVRECGYRAGRSRNNRPFIHTLIGLAVEKCCPRGEILHLKIKRTKLNHNIISFAQFVDKDKVFLHIKNIKYICEMNILRMRGKRGWNRMSDWKANTITNHYILTTSIRSMKHRFREAKETDRESWL